MTYQEHQDQRFIQGIAKGDIKVLEEIYEKYSNPIIKLVRQHNGTKNDARDVIQEGLTIIYLKTQKSNIQLTSKFLTYFFAICRNVWLKMLRKKRTKEVTLSPEMVLIDTADVEKEVIERERHQFYLKKLKELSAECQQILHLITEGKRMKEIAVTMGYKTEVYARKRKFKCKGRLIERIKKDVRYTEFVAH